MSVNYLSRELQTKAREELNEDPSKTKEFLNDLRTWANSQRHLRIRTDDQWLLTYLRLSKFNLELAKEGIDLWCTLKTVAPEVFGERDPFLPQIQELLKLGVALPLPKPKDPTEPRVLLIRIPLVDTTRISVDVAIKLILMLMDYMLNDDNTCIIAGAELLIDCKGMTMDHMMRGLGTVKRYYKCIKKAYGIKPKGVHIINPIPLVEASFKTYESIISEEHSSLIHFYKDSNKDELFKKISPAVIPTEYGGDAGPVDNIIADWKKKVESYKDWYVEDALYCSDEDKRPGGPLTAAQILRPSLLADMDEID